MSSGGRNSSTEFTGFHEVYEGVALPVLVMDRDSWEVLAVNRSAVEQYGYSRKEFIGMPILRIRPPEGQAEARRVLSQMPHGLWKTTAVEHARRDGSRFTADVWSRDTEIGGRPVRIATVSEVTERIQLQRELQQAQRMEVVGRLAGGIAHDFNNALATIIGGADLLREHIEGNEDALLEWEGIRSAALRAASLTRQLLAFSRRQVMQVETVTLDEVVGRAVEFLEPVLSRDILLECSLEAGTGPVRIDPAQMEQVVVNLATNAQDAMPEGGTLRLATRNVSRPVEERSRGVRLPAGEYAELVVRDDGVGMDDLVRARIFEPFFTTKPAPEGTGLGLSTVYGVVRQSRGFITVESAPGQGTEFRVHLPRVSGHRALRTPVEPSEATVRRALVVGEEGIRRSAREILERLGWRVRSVANGEDALAAFGDAGPALELVVTELGLPSLDARELVRRLTRSHPGLAVLFLSGYSPEEDPAAELVGPGRGLVRKPFSVESLSEAVHRVVGGAGPTGRD